jgi:hypothetical protein
MFISSLKKLTKMPARFRQAHQRTNQIFNHARTPFSSSAKVLYRAAGRQLSVSVNAAESKLV